MPLNPFKHFKFNLQLIDFISSLRISAYSIVWREGLDRGGSGKLRSGGWALILCDQSPYKWGRLGLETEEHRGTGGPCEDGQATLESGLGCGVDKPRSTWAPGSWERNVEHRLPWSLPRECGPAVTLISHSWPPMLSDKK